MGGKTLRRLIFSLCTLCSATLLAQPQEEPRPETIEGEVLDWYPTTPEGRWQYIELRFTQGSPTAEDAALQSDIEGFFTDYGIEVLLLICREPGCLVYVRTTSSDFFAAAQECRLSGVCWSEGSGSGRQDEDDPMILYNFMWKPGFSATDYDPVALEALEAIQ